MKKTHTKLNTDLFFFNCWDENGFLDFLKKKWAVFINLNILFILLI